MRVLEAGLKAAVAAGLGALVNAGEFDSRSFADWIAGRCNSAPSRILSRCLKRAACSIWLPSSAARSATPADLMEDVL